MVNGNVEERQRDADADNQEQVGVTQPQNGMLLKHYADSASSATEEEKEEEETQPQNGEDKEGISCE